MKKLMKNFFILSIIALVAMSCNDSATPTIRNVQLNFELEHRVGPAVVEYDTIIYTNAYGNKYSVATLKYFISDIRLHRTDGTEFHFDMEQYVDGRDENTTSYIPDQKIPAGDYSGITFIYGLDSVKNVPGAFPNAPENAMEWPPALGEGYHYMKLEGKFDSATIVKNYQAHTGPSRGNQFFIEVSVPNSSFTATNDSQTVTLIMNINKWWVEPNTLDLNNMSMVMGNLDMQQMLHDNGENVFSFGGVN